MNPLRIVPYSSIYAPFFYELNKAWLTQFFYIEPYDLEVLKHPETYIINKGGVIFFAILANEVVGTIALMPTATKNTLELTKMAVLSKYRGQNIGQELMKFVIDYAKTNAYLKLMLYSHTKLENAIYIYKKYGFKTVILEAKSPYKRSNIKMELQVFNLKKKLLWILNFLLPLFL